MENKRPYWQVAVSLVFSILATGIYLSRDQRDILLDAVL